MSIKSSPLSSGPEVEALGPMKVNLGQGDGDNHLVLDFFLYQKQNFYPVKRASEVSSWSWILNESKF